MHFSTHTKMYSLQTAQRADLEAWKEKVVAIFLTKQGKGAKYLKCS